MEKIIVPKKEIALVVAGLGLVVVGLIADSRGRNQQEEMRLDALCGNDRSRCIEVHHNPQSPVFSEFTIATGRTEHVPIAGNRE